MLRLKIGGLLIFVSMVLCLGCGGPAGQYHGTMELTAAQARVLLKTVAYAAANQAELAGSAFVRIKRSYDSDTPWKNVASRAVRTAGIALQAADHARRTTHAGFKEIRRLTDASPLLHHKRPQVAPLDAAAHAATQTAGALVHAAAEYTPLPLARKLQLW